MDERERDARAQDDVTLPEERVEDLEPEEKDAAEAKGGAQGFPTKWEGGS
jgi:hypothetical protein